MLINYTLQISGFDVINGYSDALIPYLRASGADSFATGWYNTQNNFSLKKFEPSNGFARRPAKRYMSKKLLKSIRTTEFDDLRDVFPVLNNLEMDEYYPSDEGSEPTPTGEALQNWEALKSMAEISRFQDTAACITSCREAITEAETLYVEIQQAGFSLRERSSSGHLELIREELDAFEHLAEL